MSVAKHIVISMIFDLRLATLAFAFMASVVSTYNILLPPKIRAAPDDSFPNGAVFFFGSKDCTDKTAVNVNVTNCDDTCGQMEPQGNSSFSVLSILIYDTSNLTSCSFWSTEERGCGNSGTELSYVSFQTNQSLSSGVCFPLDIELPPSDFLQYVKCYYGMCSSLSSAGGG